MRKTIAELLAEGQRLMEEEARKKREEMERQAQGAFDHWASLVEMLRNTVGDELAATAGLAVPVNWTRRDDQHTFSLRPFGASSFECTFGFMDSKGWEHVEPGGRCHGEMYAVQQDYRSARPGVDANLFAPLPRKATFTDSLALAVALCYLQTDGYREAEAECKRRNSDQSEVPF